MLAVEQIRPELTWRLRKEVLYPNEPLSAMQMEEDNHGYHFGAFYEGRLIAVVSLFEQGTNYQFRKFAVLPAHQGQGVGRLLLQHITAFAKVGGGQRLWCNARLSAVGFYQKQGFEAQGPEFVKKDVEYVIMDKVI